MAMQHISPLPVDKPRSCYTAAGQAKQCYPDSRVADRVAWHIERQQGEPMHAYRCTCGCWHVGHDRGRGE